MSMPRVRRLLAVAVAAGAVGLSAPVGSAQAAVDIPRPAADYRFTGNLRSSVGDAPALRNIDAKGARNRFATETDGARNRRVLRFADGAGLRLNRSPSVVPRGRYTIAMEGRFDDVSGYVRLVNFQGDAADTGFYIYAGGLSLYSNGPVGIATIDPDEWVTIVATRTGGGRFRAYIDGQMILDVDDASSTFGVVSAENVLRFFRDNPNREESSGAVDRIRLWDSALTTAQVVAISR